MLRSHHVKSFIAVIILVLVISCKEKKKQPGKKFISVLSLIREEIRHVDTSLYPIRKITSTDSTSDTAFVNREDFEKEAADFLDIPDISDKTFSLLYKQDTPLYDESLNRVIISFTPLDPSKVELKRQEVLITPSIVEGDKVQSIILTLVRENRDGYLKKEMLWQMNRSFQVVTTTQSPGQPEKTITKKVTWNEEEIQ